MKTPEYVEKQILSLKYGEGMVGVDISLTIEQARLIKNMAIDARNEIIEGKTQLAMHLAFWLIDLLKDVRSNDEVVTELGLDKIDDMVKEHLDKYPMKRTKFPPRDIIRDYPGTGTDRYPSGIRPTEIR